MRKLLVMTSIAAILLVGCDVDTEEKCEERGGNWNMFYTTTYVKSGEIMVPIISPHFYCEAPN